MKAIGVNTDCKILAIDDDLAFLRTLQSVLKPTAYVRVANNRNNFIEAFRAEAFDVIITDYKMNLWSGLDLIEYVQEQDRTLPIIIVSGVADKGMAIKCSNLQVHRIIEKPIQLDELHDAIQSAFSRKRKLLTVVGLTFGPLKLYEDTFIVENNLSRVRLTETEFNILKILVENVERRVDRCVFEKRLWGNNRVCEHTLDTHLFNLKRKLPLLKAFLKNIRGHGYLLSEFKS